MHNETPQLSVSESGAFCVSCWYLSLFENIHSVSNFWWRPKVVLRASVTSALPSFWAPIRPNPNRVDGVMARGPPRQFWKGSSVPRSHFSLSPSWTHYILHVGGPELNQCTVSPCLLNRSYSSYWHQLVILDLRIHSMLLGAWQNILGGCFFFSLYGQTFLDRSGAKRRFLS